MDGWRDRWRERHSKQQLIWEIVTSLSTFLCLKCFEKNVKNKLLALDPTEAQTQWLVSYLDSGQIILYTSMVPVSPVTQENAAWCSISRLFMALPENEKSAVHVLNQEVWKAIVEMPIPVTYKSVCACLTSDEPNYNIWIYACLQGYQTQFK